jgi:putative DNA methylase
MTIEKIDYTVTPHPSGVKAFSLKDAPALIEVMLPVQKLSIDVYKERMAGQTLTSLGSYWKGRKPLVLNRACILASLLPATDNPVKDLEVFELLMGMDDVSLSKRLGLAKPEDIVRCVVLENIEKYFVIDPPELAGYVPKTSPVDLRLVSYFKETGTKPPKLRWGTDISENTRYELSSRMLESESYRELSKEAKRAEEVEDLATHIWGPVNAHLGTKAHSLTDLTEQLGVMRFGHRPTVADTFSGSGQIPFAAAQLGCDVYASDLNPVSCMLTWGAFNIVGATPEKRSEMVAEQLALVAKVKTELDALGVETDGRGWRAKVYLYCLEVTCPSSGWRVPVLPTRLVSKGKSVVAELVPDFANKRYEIVLKSNATAEDIRVAGKGTYVDGNVVHNVSGVEHINALSAIRGDYSEMLDGKRVNKNKLRMWAKSDVVFRKDDIYDERLYAVQWIKDDGSSRPATEFRSVSAADLARESKVTKYVQEHLTEWQEKGWVPEVVIEAGDKTDEPIRTRGWTHWHHLFNPRQLTICALTRKHLSGVTALSFAQLLNYGSRLSRWDPNPGPGRVGKTQAVFDSQALNPLYNNACRSFFWASEFLTNQTKSSALAPTQSISVNNHPAVGISEAVDIFVTDPPYGDAVKYEEILEFFIAWLRKAPPAEFSNWTWDSRRELAVKGEDHDFKLSMVAAYKRMAECMPDNGLQIVMFTHQSGNIWADMANIVWASGLRVSAAWYIVTETDSALRDGSYVKGTILLVLRKRLGNQRTNQTDLSYELEEEVAHQVNRLTGLNDEVAASAKRPKDGNLFEDADLQMAGYAAALQVLTKYSIIDGKDMTQEALRPRTAGQRLLVDELIDFAVNTANKALVPHGLDESLWHGLNPAERFYLKMLDMESRGLHSLDNYQNFAKAFSVRDWQALMGSDRANDARLRTAVEFGRAEMGEGSVLFNTSTRAVLYALMDLQTEKDIDDVLAGLPHNLVNYYSERATVAKLAAYFAKKVEEFRPAEASAARILTAAIDNQRL